MPSLDSDARRTFEELAQQIALADGFQLLVVSTGPMADIPRLVSLLDELGG